MNGWCSRSDGMFSKNVLPAIHRIAVHKYVHSPTYYFIYLLAPTLNINIGEKIRKHKKGEKEIDLRIFSSLRSEKEMV